MNTRLVASTAMALLLFAGEAAAGGFALREQSTIGQGASFAGVAAGAGGLSSLFWNPAISSEYNEFGFISENNAALVLPYSKSDLGSGNIGKVAVLPAGYMSYGLTDQITIASSFNAPLGLTTDGRDGWAGSPLGDKSAVATYNFNPTVSYKFNDMLSVGVGAQVQFMSVELSNRSAPGGVKFANFEGDDFGLGFTAGILFEPTDTTDIGIGFRSSVSHTLKGDGFVTPLGFNGDISAKFKSPEIVTFGVKQQVTDQLSLMGGVEWANWSRFKELRITRDDTGATVGLTPQKWKDSWFFSLGAEYAYSDALTLRAGAAYEKSPVPDATRTVRIPDNDRYWLSLGASYQFSEKMRANFAYSHVFIKDGDVLAPNTSFKQHLDIVSVGLTRDW